MVGHISLRCRERCEVWEDKLDDITDQNIKWCFLLPCHFWDIVILHIAVSNPHGFKYASRDMGVQYEPSVVIWWWFEVETPNLLWLTLGLSSNCVPNFITCYCMIQWAATDLMSDFLSACRNKNPLLEVKLHIKTCSELAMKRVIFEAALIGYAFAGASLSEENLLSACIMTNTEVMHHLETFMKKCLLCLL